MTDSDARLFWRAALVAEKHPDTPACIVENARLLHEFEEANISAPDVTAPPHARGDV